MMMMIFFILSQKISHQEKLLQLMLSLKLVELERLPLHEKQILVISQPIHQNDINTALELHNLLISLPDPLSPELYLVLKPPFRSAAKGRG